MNCDFELTSRIRKIILRRNFRRLLVFLNLLYLVNVFGLSTNVFSHVNPINDENSPSSITNIFIDSDDDFVTYGFLGNGSKSNPFLIENYTLSGGHSKPAVVEIRNTSKSFRINNCSISFGHIGILFSNVSEGSAEITNCSFSDFTNSSIYLHKSTSIRISFNEISNSNKGIITQNCFSVNISYNNLSSCNLYFDGNLASLVSHNVTENKIDSREIKYLISLNNKIIYANELGQLILVNCSEVYIQNEYIDFEVNIHYCSDCTFRNNDFSFHDSTLELVNSNTIEITNNDFTDCLKAIKFINSLNCLVFDNLFNYCHEGIFLHSSNEIEISNNNITQSRYVDSIGVGSGIYLDNSERALIQNNLIQSCGESAINVTNSPDITIMGNTIINNFIGIYLEEQEKGISFSFYGSYIYNNNIYKNKLYGINTKNSNYLRVSANNIYNNSYLGILIEESKFSLIENNICSENSNNGVLLKNSIKINIRNNLIKLNEYNGILLMNTSYSIITYNSLEENKKYGLSLDYKCSENIIHHNHFLYNNLAGTSQASDDGFSNIWFIEEIEQGNYWNNHEQENDYYQIDGNAKSRDLYPLSDDAKEEKTNAINFHSDSLVFLIFTLGFFYFWSKKKRK